MAEILYQAMSDLSFNDALFEIVIPTGQVWGFVGIKPNGNVLRRGNISITLTNEVVNAYFVRIA